MAQTVQSLRAGGEAPRAVELGELGAFVYDLQAECYVFCSQSFARIHDLSVAECRAGLNGRSRLERIEPGDRDRYREVVSEAAARREPYRIEYTLCDASGHLRRVLETAEFCAAGDDAGDRLIGCLQDVSACREAEAALKAANESLERRVAERTAELEAARESAERAERAARASTDRFLAAAESLMDGLAIYDAEDRLVYHNGRYPEHAPPAFRERIRIGARFADLIRAADDGEGMYHPSMGRGFALRRLEHHRQPREDQIFRIADGRWMRVRESATPDGGRVLLTRDVTDRKRAEEEQREREQLWRAIAEGVPLPIVIARIYEPEVLFANRRAKETFGLELGEQADGIRRAYVCPADRRTLVRRLEQEGRVDNLEVRLQRADGTLMWALLSAIALSFEGRPALLAAVTDITERRAAEEALRASEARFMSFFRHSPVGMYVKDTEGRYVLAHEYLSRACGWPTEDIVGRTAGDIFPPEFADKVAARHREVVESGRATAYEEYIPRLDGGSGWHMVIRFPIRDAEGAIIGVGGFVVDIDERKRAEEALRESESRLSAFMEHAPVGMFVKELDDRMTLISPGIERVTGYPVEQMRGRRAAELVPPDAAARIAAADRQLIETGRVIRYEECIAQPGGEFWNLVIRFPIRDATGRIAQIGGFRIDITEQRHAEQALRESEARLSAFMEHAPVGMYVKDLAGRYVMLNPEMSKVLQADAAYMLGRTVAESPAGHPAERITGFDREVLETGRVKITEEHTANHDVYEWEMVIRFPIRNAAGEITHIAGFDVDITERKRMEEALRASEQRFKAFAEAHPVPVVISQLEDQRILFASPPFLELFRTTWEDLNRGSLARLYADPQKRQEVLELIRREGGVQGLEVQLRKGDGSVFWGAFNSRLIDYEGKAAVVSGVIDISERKRAEEELERQREALVQSEKMSALGSLLASVAHELNNPLSVVVGQAAMLEELAEGTAMAERAGRIRGAAERCARIVKTFLAMARSKPPRHGEVKLNDVVQAALDIAMYGLRSTGARVELELAPDLPPLWADADQLHQVLTNLIINAKQAMQSVPGERRLAISSRYDPETRAVVLEVADTGPGLKEEVRRRIFEPFFTTKPHGVGTGIGLSVSQRIVSAHGGTIEVANRPDGGARFTVRLPLAHAPETATGAGEVPAPAASRPAARVLVVDDEPDVGEVLAEILRCDGLEVEVVASGRAALARLAVHDYDLVISDLRMPDVDGPALYRELGRARPEVQARMMFVTGDTLSPDASEFIGASGRPVIDKPFDPHKIRQLAADHLTRLGARVRP